jgi:hypothetical protein
MVDAPRHPVSSALNPSIPNESIFDHQLSLAQIGPESFRPRAAVYMLWASDKPILLSTTANLGHAVRTRLDPGQAAHKTDYRAITSHVSWRYVNSAFAANWWYLRASRIYYPDQYRSLLGWHPAWFLRVDMGTSTVPPTVDVRNSVGNMEEAIFGPFASRRIARQLANWLIDHFELCRYEDILRKSPLGQACAYKEMGKCPAPCDGTVSMDAYRHSVADAIAWLMQIAPITRSASRAADLLLYQLAAARMKQAAVRMDFRLAAKIKTQLEALDDQFHSLPDGWGPVNKWKYIVLHRGQTSRWIEPWLVAPGDCRCLPPVQAKDALADAPAFIHALNFQWESDALPAAASSVTTDWQDDILALLTYHLNRTRDPGLYLSPAMVGRESDLAARLADWLGQPATATVAEMASDAVARPGQPEMGEAAGNDIV